MAMIRLVCLTALVFLASQALAQRSLEVIPLRHRTAEQVLPALQPLLEPGGTLTGHRNQLIVRTSPHNLGELRQALAAIDRPLRRLQISVRFDDARAAEQRQIEAGGRISNRDARIELHGQESRSESRDRVDQRIQVLEGGRAFIMTGRATPVPGGTWETGSGFEAVPRLSGDTVFIDIAQQKESFDRQQRLATTLSARLGEWVEVGGAASSSQRDGRGIASARGSTFAGSRRVWLKVEELRP